MSQAQLKEELQTNREELQLAPGASTQVKKRLSQEALRRIERNLPDAYRARPGIQSENLSPTLNSSRLYFLVIVLTLLSLAFGYTLFNKDLGSEQLSSNELSPAELSTQFRDLVASVASEELSSELEDHSNLPGPIVFTPVSQKITSEKKRLQAI